jgi:hypothetical protein
LWRAKSSPTIYCGDKTRTPAVLRFDPDPFTNQNAFLTELLDCELPDSSIVKSGGKELTEAAGAGA